MKEIHCIHDRTFKNAMSHISVARDFFDHYLPTAIRDIIDFDTLDPQPNSYIDKELDELRSDVLFAVNIADHSGYLYLLCEHQSDLDPLMPFRLWGYMIKIWEEHLKKTKDKKLPLIFPMVFYHGKAVYSGPRTLKTLIQGPEDIIQ